jgi:uncharacterized protein (DUF2147 family)
MQVVKKFAVLALAGAFAVGLVGAASAGSDFEGRWKVKDGKGHPFEIVLTADGKAAAEHKDKPMTGTWKEENGAAVINWNTGWTTKIAKDGTGYKKEAWDKDRPLGGPPSNTSAAEKAD